MQLDLYRNSNPASNRRFPYLLDVQASLLRELETRVVVPLMARRGKVLSRLTPIVEVDGRDHVVMVPQIAAVRRAELGPRVGNLAAARDQLVGALDLLFTGA